MGALAFTATLQARGPAAAVILDDERVAAVGEGAKRFPVVATVNGYVWRTTVMRMRGEFMVGLNAEVRAGAGVQAGDTVDVELALDTAPREVDVPPALAEALESDSAAKAAYEKLSFTHRKEYARWITEAKRQETRERRVAQTVEKLKEEPGARSDSVERPRRLTRASGRVVRDRLVVAAGLAAQAGARRQAGRRVDPGDDR